MPVTCKCVTKDNKQSPEYHVVVAIRRLSTVKNGPADHTMIKMISKSDLKRPTRPPPPPKKIYSKDNNARGSKQKYCQLASKPATFSLSLFS